MQGAPEQGLLSAGQGQQGTGQPCGQGGCCCHDAQMELCLQVRTPPQTRMLNCLELFCIVGMLLLADCRHCPGHS